MIRLQKRLIKPQGKDLPANGLSSGSASGVFLSSTEKECCADCSKYKRQTSINRKAQMSEECRSQAKKLQASLQIEKDLATPKRQTFQKRVALNSPT